jgi:hypothetical protein
MAGTQWQHKTWGDGIECGETNERQVSRGESTDGGGARCVAQSAKNETER